MVINGWSNFGCETKQHIRFGVIASSIAWGYLTIFVFNFGGYFLLKNVVEAVDQVILLLLWVIRYRNRFKFLLVTWLCLRQVLISVYNIVSFCLQCLVTERLALVVLIFIFDNDCCDLPIGHRLLIFDDILGHIIHVFVVIGVPTLLNLLLQISWLFAIVILIIIFRLLCPLIFTWLLLV